MSYWIVPKNVYITPCYYRNFVNGRQWYECKHITVFRHMFAW